MTISTVESKVERILENDAECRDSDTKLFATYLASKGVPSVNVIDFFNDFAVWQKRYDLPSFETIRRSRQKVQARRSDLKPSEKVQELRGEKQLEFWKWARK